MTKIADVIAGTRILASWGNQIRDRTIATWTSASDRTTNGGTASAGQVSWRSDNQKGLDVYDGANWAEVGSPPWVTYTPTPHAVTTDPVVGNGTLTGAWRRRGSFTDLYVAFVLGSTSAGGAGAITFNLPEAAPAGIAQQNIDFVINSNTTGRAFQGRAFITAGATVTQPFAPAAVNDCSMAGFRNADASGAAGTGIPFLSGLYPVTAGGSLILSGTYRNA